MQTGRLPGEKLGVAGGRYHLAVFGIQQVPDGARGEIYVFIMLSC